jgi:hypothetical protein
MIIFIVRPGDNLVHRYPAVLRPASGHGSGTSHLYLYLRSTQACIKCRPLPTGTERRGQHGLARITHASRSRRLLIVRGYGWWSEDARARVWGGFWMKGAPRRRIIIIIIMLSIMLIRALPLARQLAGDRNGRSARRRAAVAIPPRCPPSPSIHPDTGSKPIRMSGRSGERGQQRARKKSEPGGPVLVWYGRRRRARRPDRASGRNSPQARRPTSRLLIGLLATGPPGQPWPFVLHYPVGGCFWEPMLLFCSDIDRTGPGAGARLRSTRP